MGRSFFTGNDNQLYTGSAAFSTQITAAPTAYGLTAAQATAYAALNDTYATAYLAATDPATRTRGAVAAKNTARAALRANASELAKLVDGTSTVTDQQKIDLGLSVRAVPTPVNTLGKPGNCTVTLDETGAVNLKWKCANPRATGTVYQIWRRIGAEIDFTYLGGVGPKRFADATIPAGSSQVTYQIQAVRSTAAGPWAQFNVNFGAPTGSAGSGMASPSVVETTPAAGTPARMAA